MPNYFQLIGKESKQPMPFSKIDDEICAHFGWTPDKHMYVYGWYDVIGFAIAVGKPLGSQVLRDYVATMPSFPEALLCILDYLEERYTSDAWFARKFD